MEGYGLGVFGAAWAGLWQDSGQYFDEPESRLELISLITVGGATAPAVVLPIAPTNLEVPRPSLGARVVTFIRAGDPIPAGLG